ncbi:MAG: hypothetical protein MI784_17345 [Cytophagales bacterium]|nr:hypothetical protein [Cytophagales bacterium]
MKKLILALAFLCLGLAEASAQRYEYKVVTTVESIIPGGLGRSRIIENTQGVNVKDFTTKRSSGKDSKQGHVRRRDAKIKKLKETKLLNFYSLVGINFQNIASNDALITSKMNEIANDGWELAFIASGVESDAGDKDNQGIFITRFVFKKLVN